nr:HU family DNA-binding protein [uncultured Rhodospira sp.]
MKGVSPVNKNDLIAAVAENAELSKADATKAVDSVFETITEALKDGTEVRLVGFGTFVVSERAESEGRNPRTGEKIVIPASRQPKFKAGKALKDAVN